jgi:hypothetical protein
VISEPVGSYVGGLTLSLISELITLVVVPQGKWEFPSPRVARLSVQNFPTTSVRYGKESLFPCRPLNDSLSIKFSCATSPVRHFVRPLSSAQPLVKVAALGSTLFAGAIFLRGNVASVMHL